MSVMRLLAPGVALAFCIARIGRIARIAVAGIATVAALSASSCTSLPPLGAGVCGNGVIEHDHGEDCDGFAAGSGTSCRPPGVVGECRFECNGDAKSACPAGYGCGKDSVCRAGSSTFGPAVSIASSDVKRLVTGDFDGDGRSDVVAETALDVRVHYFDDNFALGTTLRVPLARARATLSHFPEAGSTGPTLDDLVVSNSGGVDVLQGRADRTLAPTVYPAFPIPGTSVRLIALEALPQNPGVELFVMGGTSSNAAILRVSTRNGAPDGLFALPALPDKLAGDIMIANFFESATQSPCEEFAMAFQGESRVLVFTPCRLNGSTIELNRPIGGLPQVLLPGVSLPANATATGLRTGRINADTHYDLLINTTAGIFVAYGVGDGTFHSSLPVPAASGDGRASAFTMTVTAGGSSANIADFPLAVADLNLDTLADFVLPKGIVFNGGDGTYGVSVLAPQPWNVARIADVNGNGLRDIIAATDSGIDFYNGTGTRLLNHATYVAAGPVGFVAIGDVDGDLVNDIVFRASAVDSTSNANEDDLSIMFGRALAYPDAPVVIGRLPSISEIAVSPFESSLVNEGQPADDIADIAAVSKSGDTLVVAALAGRADRQLASPFSLVDGKNINDRALFPSLFATGIFEAPDPGSAASPSIAALAYDSAATEANKVGTSRLWIAPLTGATSVDTANIRPGTSTLPKLDYEHGAQMVAVDLDDPSAGGVDEVVLLASPGLGGPGALFVARLTSGQWVTEQMAFGVGGAFREWRLVAADVDGDGAKDVVALHTDGPNDTHKVTVLWNTRSGRIDPAGASTAIVAPPSDAASLAIACVNLDRDPALEIVIITAKAAYFAKLDAGARKFGGPKLLLNVAGGTSLAEGDVDADGVADLVIAGGGAVSIYPGVSAIR